MTATFETHATASHRYYMRKTKAEIVQRIRDILTTITIPAAKKMVGEEIDRAWRAWTPGRTSLPDAPVILSDIAGDMEMESEGSMPGWFHKEDWLKHDIASAAMLAHELLGKVQAMPELTSCAADCDDMCDHPKCPQNRDGEPAKTGRHCPLHDPAWRDGDE